MARRKIYDGEIVMERCIARGVKKKDVEIVEEEDNRMLMEIGAIDKKDFDKLFGNKNKWRDDGRPI